jgi:hypothetical protein
VTTTAQEVSTRQLDLGDYYWGVYVERGGKRKPIFQKAHKVSIQISMQ